MLLLAKILNYIIKYYLVSSGNFLNTCTRKNNTVKINMISIQIKGTKLTLKKINILIYYPNQDTFESERECF